MTPAIDPASPVPLYHQIAESIRGRMERGELRAGDALDPMRRAAEHWGVNLHTVRHAYAALAREGLLEMRSARGTRVTEAVRGLRQGPAIETVESVEAFLTRTLREAAEHHGLGAGELAARLTARTGAGARQRVAVVECSAWQCESHAAEIREHWQVDAFPWPLANESEPEADAVIATYFHYNDIRRRWPRLLERVRFLTLHVDPELEAWLGDADSVRVVERDEPTAGAIVADLRAAFRREVDLQWIVTEDPAAWREAPARARVLFSPRVWSELRDEVRRDERCAVVRYEFDRAELENAATECGWERAFS